MRQIIKEKFTNYFFIIIFISFFALLCSSSINTTFSERNEKQISKIVSGLKETETSFSNLENKETKNYIITVKETSTKYKTAKLFNKNSGETIWFTLDFKGRISPHILKEKGDCF